MAGTAAKTEQALLPCPFCGSKNVDPEGWSTLPQYAATPEERSGPACDDCEATAPSINMWNSRHLSSHADLVQKLRNCVNALDYCLSILPQDELLRIKIEATRTGAHELLVTLTA